MKFNLIHFFTKKIYTSIFIFGVLSLCLQFVFGLAINDGLNMSINSLSIFYFYINMLALPYYYLKVIFFERNNQIQNLFFSNFVSKIRIENNKLFGMTFITCLVGIIGQFVPIYFRSISSEILSRDIIFNVIVTSAMLYAAYAFLYTSIFQLLLRIKAKEVTAITVYIFLSVCLPFLSQQWLYVPNQFIKSIIAYSPFYFLFTNIPNNQFEGRKYAFTIFIALVVFVLDRMILLKTDDE